MNLKDLLPSILPTDAEFEQIIRDLIDALRLEVEQTPTRGLMPRLFAFTWDWPDGKHSVEMALLNVDFNDADQKRLALRTLGRKCWGQRRIPRAAVLITEAWMAQQKEGREAIAPRDDPGRQEVAVVNGMTLDLRARMTSLALTRVGGNIRLGEPGELLPCEPRLLGTFFAGFSEVVQKKYLGRDVSEASIYRPMREGT